MSQSNNDACAGKGTTSCVSPRERDKKWCEGWIAEAEQDERRRSLALRLHDGDAAARAEIGKRFALLTDYLMLRGGTNFLGVCRAAVTAERWGYLVWQVASLEDDFVRDQTFERVDDGGVRAVRTGSRIPDYIDPAGPLFPDAAAP